MLVFSFDTVVVMLCTVFAEFDIIIIIIKIVRKVHIKATVHKNLAH